MMYFFYNNDELNDFCYTAVEAFIDPAASLHYWTASIIQKARDLNMHIDENAVFSKLCRAIQH